MTCGHFVKPPKDVPLQVGQTSTFARARGVFYRRLRTFLDIGHLAFLLEHQKLKLVEFGANCRKKESSPATSSSHPVWQTWKTEQEARLEELKAPQDALPPSSLPPGCVEAPDFLELSLIRPLILVPLHFPRGGSYGEGHRGHRRHQ